MKLCQGIQASHSTADNGGSDDDDGGVPGIKSIVSQSDGLRSNRLDIEFNPSSGREQPMRIPAVGGFVRRSSSRSPTRTLSRECTPSVGEVFEHEEDNSAPAVAAVAAAANSSSTASSWIFPTAAISSMPAPDISQEHHDIAFLPPDPVDNPLDHDGIASATEITPRDGGFAMGRTPSLMRPGSAESHDIDFSPGGSEMMTAPPPRMGSYNEGRPKSPNKRTSSSHDINVSPEKLGRDMPTGGVPQYGSFKIDRKTSLVAPHAAAAGSDGGEMEIDLLPTGGVSRPGSIVTDTRTTSLARSISADSNRDFDFAPGASEMETAAPPRTGSYIDDPRLRSPKRDINFEINFSPEQLGKEMPTTAPPKQGSFVGKHDIGEELGISVPQIWEPQQPNSTQSSSTMDQDIDFNPQSQGLGPNTSIARQGNHIEHSPIRTTHGEIETEATENTARDQVATISSDDDEEDDPMTNDQDLWRSKKMWETAKLSRQKKQMEQQSKEKGESPHEAPDPKGAQDYVPSKSIQAMEDRLNEILSKSIEMDEQTAYDRGIIPCTSAESDDLSGSIETLGALLGSVHREKSLAPQEQIVVQAAKGAESEVLSHSIQQLGALLGSPNMDVIAGESEEQPKQGTNARVLKKQETHETPIDSNKKNLDMKQSSDDPEKCMAAMENESDRSIHDDLLDELLGDDDDDDDEQNVEPPSAVTGADAAAAWEGHYDAQKMDDLPDDNTVEADNMTPNDTSEYVPDDSMAKLEAFLDEALDAPLESEGGRKSVLLKEDVPDDSTSGLDDFLDKALDDELEITFESATAALLPQVENEPISKVSSDTKSFPRKSPAPKNRVTTKVSTPSYVRQKKSRRSQSSSKSITDTAKTRKPSLSRFRRTKEASEPTKKVGEGASLTRTRKPGVARFRSSAPEGKEGSVIAGTLASRKKQQSNDIIEDSETGKSSTRPGGKRAKKFMSRLTSWTQKGTDKSSSKDKPPAQDSHIPTYTPAQSCQKAKPPPVRLFGAPSRRKADVAEKSSSSSRSGIMDRLSRSQRAVQTTNDDKEDGKKFTHMPSLREHKDRYNLSHLSVGSLSSQSTVSAFQSPRRTGARGCQNKFDPYLHDGRGPCGLCVFFLSSEDKIKLDATGRHVRVMFTTGGCCATCEVFPRDVDGGPARLCRACYGNSHRRVYQRHMSSKGQHIFSRH